MPILPDGSALGAPGLCLKKRNLHQRSLEKGLQSRILKALRKKFPTSFWYKASDMRLSGIPDILGCVFGNFIAIEVKVAPNKPTPLQKATLRKMQKAGGWTMVAYDVKSTLEFVEGIFKT